METNKYIDILHVFYEIRLKCGLKKIDVIFVRALNDVYIDRKLKIIIHFQGLIQFT